MKSSVWIFAVALAVLPAQGYVLLTANIEDLQAIAQRIVDSPMSDHVTNILRRASNVFTHHVNRAEDDDGPNSKGSRRSDTKASLPDEAVTVTEAPPLGNNASVFLRSIKKIFENV